MGRARCPSLIMEVMTMRSLKGWRESMLWVGALVLFAWVVVLVLLAWVGVAVAAHGDGVVVNVFVEAERPRSSGLCDQRCREAYEAGRRAGASWTPQHELDRKLQPQMQEKLHWEAAEHTQ